MPSGAVAPRWRLLLKSASCVYGIPRTLHKLGISLTDDRRQMGDDRWEMGDV